MNDEPNVTRPARPKPPPLQFGIKALLILTAVVALVSGVLKWANVSTRGSVIVLVVLTAGLCAAVALVAVITYVSDE